MRKKDYSLLIAAFIGLSSGWAVLNQDVLAAEEEFDQKNQEIQAEPQTDKEDPDSDSESGTNNINSLPDPEGTENGNNIASDPGMDQKDQLDDEAPDESEEPEESGKETSLSVNEQPSKPLGTVEKVEGLEESLAETVSVNTVPKKAAVETVPAKAANVLNGWNGNKYYENNVMAVGEKKIGNELYLFDNDGNPISGFIRYDGKTIHCTDKGKVQTGKFWVGNQSFTASNSGEITASDFSKIPYLNQYDARWKNITIGTSTLGSAGCAVMTATSIINYFNNTNYSPVDIGKQLNQAGYFNKGMVGSTNDMWQWVAKKYNLTWKGDLDANGIKEALLGGNIVAVRVKQSRWCASDSSHQIYLAGYKDGKVNVYDPYNDDQMGYFTLKEVMDARSPYDEDTRAGGPFIALGKQVIKVVESALNKMGTIVIGDQAYTGNPVTTKPIVGIYQNGSYIQLTEGKDYSVSFANNTKAGEATVTVTGKGIYKGTLSKAFYIVNNTIANATYTLSSSGNGSLVLDTPGASKNAGIQLQLYTQNDTSAQQFVIEKQANGYYTIKNKNSGLYLTSSSDWRNVHNGLALTQQKLRNDKSSLWMLRSTANGYVISSAWDSTYVLDVPAAVFKNGTKIQLYSRNGSKAQLWNLNNLDAKTQSINELAAANVKTLADGYYTIASKINTSKVIDVAGASASNGANVQIYSRNGTQAQLFQISHVGNFLKITNVASGKVLDVNAGTRKSGTNVQQYAWNGSDAQLWIAVNTSDGIKLVSGLDQNLVLDLNAAATYNGNNISIYSNNNSKAQRWIFQKAEDPRAALNKLAAASKNIVAAGTYEIHSMVNGNYNLDVTGANKTNGANVQLYEDNNTKAQRWKISFDSNGYALIENINSGKYLSLATGNVQSGENIVQKTGTSYAQKWVFRQLNGAVQIVSALNKDYVIDLSGAHSVNGRNINLYANNGSKAQQWKFVKV